MTAPAIYSARADGLGARLTSLLAAMRVAELLDLEFKFTWTGLSTWTTKFRAVDGHSIVAPHEFFGRQFLDRHFLDPRSINPRDVLTIPELKGPPNLTLRDLRNRCERDGAIRVAGVPPLEEMLSSDFPPTVFSMRDCFERIEFSAAIQRAIDAARNVDIGRSMTALHLRGGDIVYGQWRKRVRWTYKSIPIPIAKAMVQWALERGDAVLCFGTDDEVLEHLSKEYGILNGSEMSAQFDTPAERAMFELALMSRASEIIAGTSLFAKLAASLDRIDIHRAEQIINRKRREGLCISDLMANANAYSPLQTAFAYWYLYYDRRQQRSSRANIEWLNKAQEFDPDNGLYALVKAALLYKIEADDEAEKVIQYALSRDVARGDNEVFRVLGGQTAGQQNLREYQPYFHEASLRGQPYASVLQAVVERAKGNARECERILRQPPARRVDAEVLALMPAG